MLQDVHDETLREKNNHASLAREKVFLLISKHQNNTFLYIKKQ